MDITESLKEIIQSSPTAPFLFIGSGFSRRYLGLEDWRGLLNRFGSKLPSGFLRYISESNNDLALAAERMTEPYSSYWWSLPEAQEIASQENWYAHISSPLRYDICQYLSSYKLEDKKLQHELDILTSPKTIIDGIITTNWDLLLEELFNHENYKVYIGQSRLLFSNPQKIAEIYKIHGCCTDPKSLVLTKSDYDEFHKKNPYLAAKLLSIFIEHPIIFIGYSLDDENIRSILCSISEMMSNDHDRDKLANNLIFINWEKGGKDSISKTHFNFTENKSIPITEIRTDDFSKIYLALQGKERQIPAYILRIFKEQFYEIVQGQAPNRKLYCATNIEEIMYGTNKIEFVAGFGVATRGRIGDIGLQGIEIHNLLHDIAFNSIEFQNSEILIKSLPNLKHKGTYIPIHKYLYDTELDLVFLKKSGLYKNYERSKKWYKDKVSQTYQRAFAQKNFQSIQQILSSDEYILTGKIELLSLYILKNNNEKNLDRVLEFIKENFDKSKSNSNFKRLICIYDLLKFKK